MYFDIDIVTNYFIIACHACSTLATVLGFIIMPTTPEPRHGMPGACQQNGPHFIPLIVQKVHMLNDLMKLFSLTLSYFLETCDEPYYTDVRALTIHISSIWPKGPPDLFRFRGSRMYTRDR